MAATATTQPSILDRAIRAAKLDRAVYEEVEADRTATTQAATVVAVSSILAGIGATEGALSQAITTTITALVAWAAYAWIAYYVGTRLIPDPGTKADWGEVARTLGFASAPRAVGVLGVVPGLGVLAVAVAGLWTLVATVVAVQAALDVRTGKAIGIAVVSYVGLALVQYVVVSLALGGGVTPF